MDKEVSNIDKLRKWQTHYKTTRVALALLAGACFLLAIGNIILAISSGNSNATSWCWGSAVWLTISGICNSIYSLVARKHSLEIQKIIDMVDSEGGM